MKTSATRLAIALATVFTLGSVRAAEPVAPAGASAPATMERELERQIDKYVTYPLLERVHRMDGEVFVSFVIDTLEYLRKGGRCSTVAALGANLLKLKPCIEVHEGKMSVAKKYRGTLAKAIESYVTDRIKDHDDFDTKRVFITDSGVDMEIVETVEKLLREYGGFEEIHHTLAGSTISGHCGPGCLGILYYNR